MSGCLNLNILFNILFSFSSIPQWKLIDWENNFSKTIQILLDNIESPEKNIHYWKSTHFLVKLNMFLFFAKCLKKMKTVRQYLSKI